MSMPFLDEEFVFTQPNGKSFTVRGTGDQYGAVFRTPSGHPVIRDPASGYYEYGVVNADGQLEASGVEVGSIDPLLMGAAPDAAALPGPAPAPLLSGLPRVATRWETRRNQRRALQQAVETLGIDFAPPQRETVGTYVGLCLLVQFPDVPGAISRAEVDAFCNATGYSGFGNNGSVKDYFYDVSGGKLTYTNIVAPYYTAKQPRSYYTNESVTCPIRAIELVNEALAFHKANGFDFTGLTADSDNYVYAVNVFYAGTRVNNWAQGLWPHSYHLDAPVPLAPGKNAYDYQITDLTDQLSLGTFCHENGHMICDFPDLYDYGRESYGAGVYCLMCSGANVNQKNPTHVGAYLKRSAGWVDAIHTLAPGQVSLAAGKNDFAILRKNPTEYFILENRAKAGRDIALPGPGLAIWHVDELGNNSNEQMTPASHYECSLEQADGLFGLEKKMNQGDPTDLFAAGGKFGNGTTPASKWWDASPSALEIEQVSAPGPVVTFVVK